YRGAWSHLPSGEASGGSLSSSTDARDGEASLRWSGRAVTLVMTTGPAMGIARMTVDGVARQVDPYSTDVQYQQEACAGEGLREADHTVSGAPRGGGMSGPTGLPWRWTRSRRADWAVPARPSRPCKRRAPPGRLGAARRPSRPLGAATAIL